MIDKNILYVIICFISHLCRKLYVAYLIYLCHDICTLLIIIYINAFIDIIYDEMSGTCIGLSTLHPQSLPHLRLAPRSLHFLPEGLRNLSQFPLFFKLLPSL